MSTLGISSKGRCFATALYLYVLPLVACVFVSSSLLYAQSVTFADTETILPASLVVDPSGVAVDGAGDVFIANYSDDGNLNRVVELPRTATGYGPQTTLPFGAYLTAMPLTAQGMCLLSTTSRMAVWWNCRRRQPATGRPRPCRPAVYMGPRASL